MLKCKAGHGEVFLTEVVILLEFKDSLAGGSSVVGGRASHGNMQSALRVHECCPSKRQLSNLQYFLRPTEPFFA